MANKGIVAKPQESMGVSLFAEKGGWIAGLKNWLKSPYASLIVPSVLLVSNAKIFNPNKPRPALPLESPLLGNPPAAPPSIYPPIPTPGTPYSGYLYTSLPSEYLYLVTYKTGYSPILSLSLLRDPPILPPFLPGYLPVPLPSLSGHPLTNTRSASSGPY